MDISASNSREDLILWIRELEAVIFYNARSEDLLELNYKQASKIMELEQEIRMLKLVVDNKEEDTQPELAPLQGGGGGFGEDWLSPMVCGTEFLVYHRANPNPWLLTEFTHGGKRMGCVLLIPTKTMNDTKTWIWVDPIEFCMAFEKRAVLEVPEE